MTMNTSTGAPVAASDDAASATLDYDMIIVGAGFAGLRMLVEARALGYSARVIESGSGIGGTWFWNRYPGARCDVFSADYSYSFSSELEQEWRWSERYPTQPEILRYVEFVAEKFELRPDITLNTFVRAATFDETESQWSVTTSADAVLRCTYLVMATGCLSTAKLPDIPGRDSFTGEVYQTATWPHQSVDFAGKRVGVIGTGSSGTQLIPVVAREAEHLTVFQRTPNFSVPARNAPIGAQQDAEIKSEYTGRRARARNSPSGLGIVPNKQSALDAEPHDRAAHYEHQWETAGFGFVLSYYDLLLNRDSNDTAADFIRAKIAATVSDPATAKKLAPTGYPFGAKRPCVDSGYFETFNRTNVTLVDIRDEHITGITTTGVVTLDGTYDLDMLVFATGFDAMTGSLLKPDIRGRGGVALRESWAQGPVTYLGLAAAGFPNFFFITGPGSPSLLSNVLVSIEQHVEWLAGLLRFAQPGATIEVTAEAAREWTEHVNETAAKTLYSQAASYYMGDEIVGKPRVFMPYSGGVRAFGRKCNEIADDGYAGFVIDEARVPVAQLTV